MLPRETPVIDFLLISPSRWKWNRFWIIWVDILIAVPLVWGFYLIGALQKGPLLSLPLIIIQSCMPGHLEITVKACCCVNNKVSGQNVLTFTLARDCTLPMALLAWHHAFFMECSVEWWQRVSMNETNTILNGKSTVKFCNEDHFSIKNHNCQV